MMREFVLFFPYYLTDIDAYTSLLRLNVVFVKNEELEVNFLFWSFSKMACAKI